MPVCSHIDDKNEPISMQEIRHAKIVIEFSKSLGMMKNPSENHQSNLSVKGKTKEMCLEICSELANNNIVMFVHFVPSFSFS